MLMWRQKVLVFNNKCVGGGGGATELKELDDNEDRILTGLGYSTSYERSVLVDFNGNVLIKNFD